MDTKLKKFDISFITKFIAFALALMFAVLGFVSAFSYFSDEDNVSAILNYDSDFLNMGKDYQIEKSNVFANAYYTYVEAAIKKTLIYGNASKKAYKAYQKEFNALVTSKAEAESNNSLKNIIANNSGKKTPVSLMEALEKNKIILTKLDDHASHYNSGSSFVYEDKNNYYYSLSSGGKIYDNGWEFDEIDDYDDNDYDEDVDYDEDSSENVSSQSVPDDILKKAKNADGVIEICNSYYQSTSFDGYYGITMNLDYYKNEIIESAKDGEMSYELYGQYFESYDDFKSSAEANSKKLSQYGNFSFAIIDNSSGEVLATTLSGTKTSFLAANIKNEFLENDWAIVRNFKTGNVECSELVENLRKENYSALYDSEQMSSAEGLLEESGDYTLCVAFDTDLSQQDVLSSAQKDYLNAYEAVVKMLVKVAACLIGFIICLVVLVIKSGKKHGDDEMHMSFFDKTPLLLKIALNGGIIAFLVFGILMFFAEVSRKTLLMNLCSVCVAAIAALLIDLILYFARNLKNHSLHNRIFITWCASKLKNAHKKRKEKPAVYKDIFNDVMRKIALFILLPNIVAALLVIFVFAIDFGEAFAVLIVILLFIYDILAVCYMIRYAYSLRKIFYALNEIRNGNYDVKINIDTEKMPKSVQAYANDVNEINEGLKIAVENAVKEQRTKTELITNVSHDLKTPLTSIITYVDLLSRCEIENEDAKSYIAVLGEKSAKLKRLIEDLVEASKAQAGSINVQLIKVSLKELVLQLAGEYEDEFTAKNLSTIISGDEEEIFVFADSKMSYRVLDNLLSNVKKYAMANTRVYISIAKSGGKGIVTVRNISANQLNIPASELMSRFVRGDSSRSTEGNGLGLSIAENFCKLQGGKLSIDINGDLFTATVEYELCGY